MIKKLINTQYQFTGQEKDEGTGLYYYHARYYHPEIGRFISVDPVSRSASEKSYFIEPQRWNQYAYTNNNPINLTDPTGELTVLEHGTGNCGDGCNKATYSDAYIEQVSSDLNEKYSVWVPEWSGGNDKDSRSIAADQMKDYINNYDFAEGEELNIIGFSHGGNVSIEAINKGLKKAVDKLILLGTPSRDDYKIKDETKVKELYNVYDPGDTVQHYWADFEQGSSQGPRTTHAGVGHDRKESNVKNIQVDSPGDAWEYGNIFKSSGMNKHSNMHTIATWNQIGFGELNY